MGIRTDTWTNEIGLRNLTLIQTPMNTHFFVKEAKIVQWKNKISLINFNMQKIENRSTCITTYKTQVQMDQRHKHKSICPERDWRKSGKYLWMHGYKRPLPKYNTSSTATTIIKWNLLKLKSFCEAKDVVNKTKWQLTQWKNTFTNPTADKELIS